MKQVKIEYLRDRFQQMLNHSVPPAEHCKWQAALESRLEKHINRTNVSLTIADALKIVDRSTLNKKWGICWKVSISPPARLICDIKRMEYGESAALAVNHMLGSLLQKGLARCAETDFLEYYCPSRYEGKRVRYLASMPIHAWVQLHLLCKCYKVKLTDVCTWLVLVAAT